MSGPPDALPGSSTRPDAKAVGKWDNCDSIFTRYKGLSGRRLQEAAFADYRVRENATLRFYGENNEKLLFRHPLNNRSQQGVVQKYAAKVKEQGAVLGVRGVPWVVAPEDPTSGRYGLMSYATLTEAIYLANEQAPESLQVQATIRTGLHDPARPHSSGCASVDEGGAQPVACRSAAQRGRTAG
jgi:hypothetical protein